MMVLLLIVFNVLVLISFNSSFLVDSEKVSNYEEVMKAGNVGVCLEIKGELVKSPAAGQPVELHVSEVKVLGPCNAATYPLAKKRHTLEHLRDIAHLRSRTNTVFYFSPFSYYS